MPNANGRTALHYAAGFNQEQALTLLLDKGANAMVADCNGWLPIHFACQRGGAMLVKILSTHCSKSINAPTKQNSGSRTPLHVAAARGSVECIEVLIACKAEVNARTTDGHTPLHFAAIQSNARAIEALLKKRADAMIEDEDRWLPLHHANSKKDDVDYARLLLEPSPESLDNRALLDTDSMTPLHIAASHGSTNRVGPLLTCLDNDQEIADKRIALHYVTQSGNKCILELPRDRSIATNSPDVNGWLPLHWACSEDNVDCARLLLEHFPKSLNSQTSLDTNSMTPLLIATSYESTNCVKLLLESLNDDQEAADKRRVSHYSAQSGNKCMLKLLKERDIASNHTDANG